MSSARGVTLVLLASVVGAHGVAWATTTNHAPALAAEPPVWTVPFTDVLVVAVAAALLAWFDDLVVAASTVWESWAVRVRAWFAVVVRVVGVAPAAGAVRFPHVEDPVRRVVLRVCSARRGPPLFA